MISSINRSRLIYSRNYGFGPIAYFVWLSVCLLSIPIDGDIKSQLGVSWRLSPWVQSLCIGLFITHLCCLFVDYALAIPIDALSSGLCSDSSGLLDTCHRSSFL